MSTTVYADLCLPRYPSYPPKMSWTPLKTYLFPLSAVVSVCFVASIACRQVTPPVKDT